MQVTGGPYIGADAGAHGGDAAGLGVVAHAGGRGGCQGAGLAGAVFVTGPNGWRREFAGDADGTAATAEVATAIAATPTRTLTVMFTSHSTRPQTVELKPRHYGTEQILRRTVAASTTVVLTWDTEDAEGWYDLDLSLAEDTSFRRRLMGHIENGRPSVSG
jgi:phospholipase C